MRSATHQGRVGMARLGLEIALDSREVFAGESIEGALVVSIKEDVVTANMRVTLEGEERTRIRSSRPRLDRLIWPSTGYIDQRREIHGVERTLRAKSRIEPPGARIPFSLPVPIDALPSYVGRFSQINWVLRARISMDPPPDLIQTAEITLLSRAISSETQVALTPDEAAMGLTLEVTGGRVEPEAHVTGWITIGNVKRKPREIRVEMLAHEVARAESRGWQEIEVKDTLLAKQRAFEKQEMVEGARKAFDLKAPRDLPPTYRGIWSSVDILLRAVADIPLRPSVSVSVPVRTGATPPLRPVD